MGKITRLKECRICNSHLLKKNLIMKNMPFTDEFLHKKDLGKEFLDDIEIYTCSKCSLVQTLKNINVGKYYLDYQYSVGQSATANNFMKKLARNINKKYFSNKKNKNILEIGSSDGCQLNEFKKLKFSVTGCEPSKSLSEVAARRKIKTINSMFTADTIKKLEKKKFDIILLSYTFDHLQNPKDFLKNIKKLLNRDGILVIEVHDLDKIFKNIEFCLFEHEHSIYLNRETAKKILAFLGFKIINFNIVSEKDRRANSLLFVAKLSNNRLEDSTKLAQTSSINFVEFKKNIKSGISNLDKFIGKAKKNGEKVAGYGAGGRGVMTLANLKNSNKLEFLLEKRPKSKNIYTPHSNIPIHDLNYLKKNKVDKILVFSFGYLKEIKKDLKQFGYKSNQITSFIEVMKGSYV